MTQCCSTAGRQDRRQPPSLPADEAMSNRIRAGVQTVQLPTRQPSLNRPSPNSKIQQLAPPNNPVLLIRKLSDNRIHATRPHFPSIAWEMGVASPAIPRSFPPAAHLWHAK
jgi:hypothetical protein